MRNQLNNQVTRYLTLKMLINPSTPFHPFQNQFGKWFGNCDTFQVSVDKCLKNERINNRQSNLEASRKRKEEIQQRMNSQE